MSILLTGGAGFIGSHTAVFLLDSGYDVIIADDFSNSKKSVVDRITKIAGKEPKLFVADLTKSSAFTEIFQAYPDIDSIIHFAGLKAVGESVEKPLLYYKTNLEITLNLLEAMEQNGITKLVFSSSATVYSQENDVPYTEASKLGASNPYGWTKVMIEQILKDVCAASPEMSVVLLRYFNPIGAHPSGLIGEDPDGIPNNLVPYIAKVAAGTLPHVNVFGGDYDTVDGTGVRDYIHVMDLAEGHALALSYLEGKTGAFAFNLGTGNGSSVLEIIAAYENACGHKIDRVITSRRAGDLPVVYADPSLAFSELGFKASRGIDEMCKDSWKWQTRAE